MEAKMHVEQGGCTCGQLRYQVTAEPMIVHGCHCRGCQKNSGSAFAINALYETEKVTLVSGEIEQISVPTPSGTGQDICRCAECKVAVWSHYNMGGLRAHICFIRVGTLDEPDQHPPGVHIYTDSKQPWVILPSEGRAVAAFYNYTEIWSAESLVRLAKLEQCAGIKIS